MRRLGIALIALTALIGIAAYGQEKAAVTPSQIPPRPVFQIIPDDASANRLDVEVGAVRLTTHSGRYTFAYLPLLAPLQGTAFRPSIEMPNALALTGTAIPQRPHTLPRPLVNIR
jgi:hypothetical protein